MHTLSRLVNVPGALAGGSFPVPGLLSRTRGFISRTAGGLISRTAAAPKIFDVKNRNVQNRPKRVYPKFHGCTTHFRGVNVRPKFCNFENYETLNGRLPAEDGSVRPQTLG